MIKLKNILTNLIVEQQANKKIRVLFVGDSQTAAPWSYARLLLRNKQIEGKIVARNGASTSAVLTMLQNNISNKYDVVSIMAGGNDGAAKSPIAAIRNFEAMFKLVQNSGAKLVVITNPTKRFVQPGDTYYKKDGYPSNDKISDWLQSNTPADVVIDTGDFTEIDFTKDNVHLDSDAHKKIASQWKRQVLELFNLDSTKEIEPEDSVLLQYGDKGSDVIKMQKALVALGYSVGKEGIDGIFGPNTRSGLIKFQRDVTQDPSGKLDTATKNILFKKSGQVDTDANAGEDSDSQSTSLASLIGLGTIAGANYSDPVEKQSAALLAGFEGFRSDAYWDSNNWRIGFGSSTITDQLGNVTQLSNDRSDKPNFTITKADAIRDLSRRLEDEFIPDVMVHAGGLNNGTIAALVSVAYNYGSLPRNVIAAIQTNDIDNIAQSVLDLKSHNGGINERRRRKEAAYILNSK
jgi:peptidoglycan hydrolase-like protein with peptidoglycan-binding domain/lysophospholipase L1-like esterase